jgi:hypothetical protein
VAALAAVQADLATRQAANLTPALLRGVVGFDYKQYYQLCPRRLAVRV